MDDLNDIRQGNVDYLKAHPGSVSSVGLWGHNGQGNLGNEETLSAAIHNLRRFEPDITLYGFSLNPEDTLERHGIPSFPIKRRGVVFSSSTHSSTTPMMISSLGWKARLKRYPVFYRVFRKIISPLLEIHFFVQAHRSLKGIDLMLVTGTGQVADSWGGVAGFPYSLFKWSLLCRIKGVKWAVVSAGVGPINSFLSRKFIKNSLSNAIYRSFRDDYSKRLIENLGVKGNIRVYPDLVFSLDLSKCGVTLQQERPKTVALNALPYREPGAWENPSSSFYQRYRDVLVRFASWLVEEGYDVHLIPTHVTMDSEFLKGFKSKINTNFPDRLRLRSFVSTNGTIGEVISWFSEVGIVVTTRFHGLIFSSLLGKPVLAVSYHPKISELMKDFGQERFCIDIEDLDFDLLVNKFKELESEKDDVSKRVLEKVELNKRLLEKQYLELLKL